MRRRIRTTEQWVKLLAELYNVSVYIARKYYNQVKGDIEKVKEHLAVHKILYPNCA